VNLILFSVRTQDGTPATFCSVQHCLVTPVLLDVTFVRPFSHGSGVWEGGFPSRDAKTTHASPALRNKCRTLLCSCFFCPCLVSLVATPPSSVSLYSVLFRLILSRPIFDTYCVRGGIPPPPPPVTTDIHKLSCTLPRGRLANF
jgi:hypothetical protein